MIRNYFKIAWRNLLKQKSFGIINLLGLTAGTICSISILLFVQNQFGYEEHIPSHKNIYKVATNNLNGNTGASDANMISSGPPIGPTIAKDYKEVIAQARIVYLGQEFLVTPENSNKSFFQDNGYLVDSTFFDVFDISLLSGDSKTAFASPTSLLLSSALAKKLFSDPLKAIGKQVKMEGGGDSLSLTVTAVFDENAGKSHIKPSYMINMAATGMGSYVLNSDEWSGNNFVHTYIKLNPNADSKVLEAKLPKMLNTYGAEQLKAANKKKILTLIPIENIHLKTSNYEFPLGKISDIKYIYLLLAIGFFIQLMACINYINLSTAQASQRAKEIGVRKVNGAGSGSLVRQFLIESLLITLLAMLIALPLTLLFLPYINELFDSSLTVSDVFSLKMFASIIGLGLFTGLVSGSYPAFFLSLTEPLTIFKKGFRTGKMRKMSLRNGLVVFQFAMVFMLIYAVSVISQQMNHLGNKDLGFSKNQKLVIPLKTDATKATFSTLKTQLTQLSQVNSVANTEFYPSQNIWYDQKVYKSGSTLDDGIVVQNNLADENFFETMGIKLLEGRSVSPTDSSQMVVNETFLMRLDIPRETAIGTVITTQPGNDGSERTQFVIVGVIKDYNFLSLKESVQPVATFYQANLSNLVMNYNTTNTSELIAEVQKVWAQVNPNIPFEFTFLDKEMEAVYAEEVRLKKVSYTFTGLAIIISLLGIWGLVSFSLERRTKEIGIRKVLGASVSGLTQLLSKEYIILVGISILICSPLAYYAMNEWLDGFAYHIQDTKFQLLIAAFLTFLVSLVTVIYKTTSAALSDPIKNLRTE